MGLDLGNLEKAIAALKRSLAFSDKFEKGDAETREIAQTAVIQCFEVAYELAWKFMQRWMELNISPDLVFGVGRREFYRHAEKNGLITDVDSWMRYHEARNKTAHTYNPENAAWVFFAARAFYADVTRLHQFLKEKTDGHPS